MGFKRLDAEDFVVSADAVQSVAWSTGAPTLTAYFTSSVQAAGSSGNYYLSVYQTSSTLADAVVQFDIAYADVKGSGSEYYNNGIPSRTPSSTIYGQYRSLVLEDENASFTFGGVTQSDFYVNFWVISPDRARYKEKLFPGTMTLHLSGSGGQVKLTDDSVVASSVTYTDAGRRYNLVSGSAGTVYTGSNANGWASSGSYGWFLPDISTIILSAPALDLASGAGGIALGTGRQDNVDDANPGLLYDAIVDGASFTMNSQETITSDFVFVRPRSSEFNYSENPSFISGSTGEVLYSQFINNPQVYITTVGLYNNASELLAVAKLSTPLVKDFTKEALIRVKLDF